MSQLSAARYVRLLAGRLDPAGKLDRGEVQIVGKRDQVLELTRIVAGIG